MARLVIEYGTCARIYAAHMLGLVDLTNVHLGTSVRGCVSCSSPNGFLLLSRRLLLINASTHKDVRRAFAQETRHEWW